MLVQKLPALTIRRIKHHDTPYHEPRNAVSLTTACCFSIREGYPEIMEGYSEIRQGYST